MGEQPRGYLYDLLEPSEKQTHCPKKGDASYFTIRVGDRVVESGAWFYPDPIEHAPSSWPEGRAPERI